LPYRSLQFKHETHNTETYQSAPVVNYPNEQLYTRVTEFKYLTGQEHSKTSIVYEFPQAEGDPYYPVPRQENADLYAKYKALADKTPGVHFVGRLATYKYYNMDQVVAQALTVYAKIAGEKRVDATMREASKVLAASASAVAASSNPLTRAYSLPAGSSGNGNGYPKNAMKEEVGA
ncbi:MAG: UDP-galactopyranose mutase, partial [Pyrinomonadaceae bacterium]|nr:UDP-galactopyranose mutase [Pyrinomonadaceae bacterium]